MGDLPDFENMTLEEQMRWLESLAARQGANPQEFTTSADMSVPEIDPNSVVIDEPGYVPSERLSRPLSAGAGPARPSAQATEPIEPVIVPPVEAPAYDYSYAEQQPTMMEYQYQEPPPIEPEIMAVADSSDPLGGMDPMAWLESLAARQGANPNEFTTAANYEIPEIDPNSVVIDEPGYVPSERFSRPLSAAAGPATPEPTFDQSATEQFIVGGESEAPMPEYAYDATPAAPAAWIPQDGEMPAEVDPMAWLESLAARQGADPVEFTTSANYEIPEIDPNSVVIDEPGYVPYSPFETTPGQQYATTEAYQPPQPPASMPEFAMEGSEDTSSLSWLSDLAGDTGAAVPDFLSDFAADDIPGFDLSLDSPLETSFAAPAGPQMITSIEGYTDDEIAAAQAAGTITPEAELAWLMSKAQSLAALTPMNDEFESEQVFAEGEEIVGGQMPDWLVAQMPTNLDAVSAMEDSFPALIDEILPPPAPADLPDWLSESPMLLESTEIELPEFTLEDTTSFMPMQAEVLDASDLVAGYAQGTDDWATALDEEYAMQHQVQPQADEPDWYAEAVSKVEEMPPELISPEAYPEFDPTMFEMPVETEILAAEPTDLPDWLQEMSGQAAPVDSDLPEWLISSPVVETDAISEVSTPNWFDEPSPDPLSFVPESAPDTSSFSYETSLTPQTAIPEADLSFLDMGGTDERLAEAQEGGLPSWYQPAAEAAPAFEAAKPVVPQPVAPPVVQAAPPVYTRPPAPPTPVTPSFATAAASSRQVAQPVPPPSAPPPVPAGFAQYQSHLEQHPSDHNTRLNLARELEKGGNISASLEHYETLVESSAALEIVVDDLSKLSARQPQHPRVRRLLGDTYMRQGRLQEALDAYRGALNQL